MVTKTNTALELMTTVNMVPCYNCICVPVCRHKSFRDIYFQCELVRNLFGKKGDSQSIEEYKYLWIEEALKPTKWYCNCELTKTGGFAVSVEPRR